jgi:hypothetical protein
MQVATTCTDTAITPLALAFALVVPPTACATCKPSPKGTSRQARKTGNARFGMA